jgi:hypothetical protein
MPLFQVVLCGEELAGKSHAVSHLEKVFVGEGFRVFKVKEGASDFILDSETDSYDAFAKKSPLERRDAQFKALQHRIEEEGIVLKEALEQTMTGNKAVMIVDRPWWDPYYYMLKRTANDKGVVKEYSWDSIFADIMLRGRMVFYPYGVVPLYVHLAPLDHSITKGADDSNLRPSKALGNTPSTLRYRLQSYVDYHLFFFFVKSMIVHHKAVMTTAVENERETIVIPPNYRDRVLGVAKELSATVDWSGLPVVERLAREEVIKTFNEASVYAMLESDPEVQKGGANVFDVAATKEWALMDSSMTLSVLKQVLDVTNLGWLPKKESDTLIRDLTSQIFVKDVQKRDKFLDGCVGSIIRQYAHILSQMEESEKEEKLLSVLKNNYGVPGSKGPFFVN